MPRVGKHRAHPFAALWRRLGIPADYAERRHLPIQRVATRLVSIGPAADDGKYLRLAPRAAAAWRRMRMAGAKDGVELLPLSGYRSVRRQSQIIRNKLAAGEKIDDILRLVAAPGFSEHHTGRAIDIGDPEDTSVEESFARTRAYRWLRRRASEFGFHLSYPRGNRHRIAYEPWHWCWRGKTEKLKD